MSGSILAPYSPAHLCPRCGCEGAAARYHGQAIMAVFGTGLPYPCSDAPASLGEHMCCRCQSCGHAWMEASAQLPPGSIA